MKEFLQKYNSFLDEPTATELKRIREQYGKAYVFAEDSDELKDVFNNLSAFLFVLEGKVSLTSKKNKSIQKTFEVGDILLNFFPADIYNMEIQFPLQVVSIPKVHFYNLFGENPQASKQFYQLISFLVSEQIARDQEESDSEMQRLKTKFAGEIKSDVFLEKLERSKDSINETGSSIIDKLIGLMADVKSLKDSPELPTSLQETANRLFNRFMDIIASDTQNFDILFQQLHAIQQNLQNIVSVVYGDEASPQQGDKNIFAAKLVREKLEDYGDMEIF